MVVRADDGEGLRSGRRAPITLIYGQGCRNGESDAGEKPLLDSRYGAE
jgi:hypothetical protein